MSHLNLFASAAHEIPSWLLLLDGEGFLLLPTFLLFGADDNALLDAKLLKLEDETIALVSVLLDVVLLPLELSTNLKKLALSYNASVQTL